MSTLSVAAARQSAPAPTAAAELRGVTKSYGSTKALEDVSFSIIPGEVLALLGPNGAGKTTAIRLLLGLLSPEQGSISIFGRDPRKPETRARIGTMLQAGQLPHTLTAAEHIDLFRSYYPNPLPVDEIVDIAGLSGILDKLFGSMSGGQRQRVLFALSFCGNPDIVFLDEPSAGLDVETRLKLWDQIRLLASRGKTVLLTTHYLEEADALAHRIVLLNKGKVLAEGTPSEIKQQAAGRLIRCTTALDDATILKIGGVVSVSLMRSGQVEIRAEEAEAVVRELLIRDLQLANLEIANVGLETAFLALTKGEN
ncbi:MAG TPA: ABC transporter ATP-binding protein [Bryobacteraceae bacterium]|jgi:ABC-2 type transport system ATP-binding protein